MGLALPSVGWVNGCLVLPGTEVHRYGHGFGYYETRIEICRYSIYYDSGQTADHPVRCASMSVAVCERRGTPALPMRITIGVSNHPPPPIAAAKQPAHYEHHRPSRSRIRWRRSIL